MVGLQSQCHLALPTVTHTKTLAYFQVFWQQVDCGTKGALLAESKHKTSELSDICRVSKLITL